MQIIGIITQQVKSAETWNLLGQCRLFQLDLSSAAARFVTILVFAAANQALLFAFMNYTALLTSDGVLIETFIAFIV
jgi:hypothetical protein